MVKLDGSSRTLLRASEPYGSTITSIAWTQGAGDPRWPQAAAQDGVHGSGQVTDLATSGSDVAYVACGRAYLWRAGTADARLFPVPADVPVSAPSFFAQCRPTDRRRVDAIALGQNAALFAWCDCPTGYSSVQAVDLDTWSAAELGRGSALPADADAFGTLFGDESLLVFGHWNVRAQQLLDQRLQRVDAKTGCPCPTIVEAAGELEPLDVNARRIVVRRFDSLSVLNADGGELLSLPIHPLAAQLSERDVVVLLGDQLRRYNVETGC